ncbi:hypothetical protein [Methylobacillus rhizosphaerae]|uniref:hypothetical protein n=1 Tax=Methylobacillus rhizosphaerae TaxID=551994 RepID=UPI000B78B82E|nr:hypothetical protein [Methylobacillus rhizosphaerae]
MAILTLTIVYLGAYAAELQHFVYSPLKSKDKLIYKTATYPDFHGDYLVFFIVRLPAAAMEKLKTSIVSEPTHETK